MKHLRERANNIWGIIEDRMCEIYGDINSQLEENPSNEELCDLNSMLGVISSSTCRIQRIIENRLSNCNEALTIKEINEALEINEAIIYYLNEKIDNFKVLADYYEDPNKIIFNLILCRNVSLGLSENFNYLKKVTSNKTVK